MIMNDECNPARVTEADKKFAKKLGFKGIQSPVKIRDIHKIENKFSIGISVFDYGNKEKHPIYVSEKCCEILLLLIGAEGKRHLSRVMYFSKILILSCMIILYIVEENIFVILFTSFYYRRNMI